MFSIGVTFPDFVSLVEKASGDIAFGASVDHSFLGDRDMGIGCKGFEFFFFLM